MYATKQNPEAVKVAATELQVGDVLTSPLLFARPYGLAGERKPSVVERISVQRDGVQVATSNGTRPCFPAGASVWIKRRDNDRTGEKP